MYCLVFEMKIPHEYLYSNSSIGNYHKKNEHLFIFIFSLKQIQKHKYI